MELFYGGGGRSNPDFTYKVRVKNGTMSRMMEWCDNYPTDEKWSCFQRYYIDYRNGRNDFSDSEYVTFQFEWEEPAIMFALKFGESLA